MINKYYGSLELRCKYIEAVAQQETLSVLSESTF